MKDGSERLLEDMLDVNRAQTEFYDRPKKNLPTRLWSNFRGGLLRDMRLGLRASEEAYELQRSWLGDLRGKRVLDLGCSAGNALSLYLAANASSYVAIDLSRRGIESLEKRLAAAEHRRCQGSGCRFPFGRLHREGV